MPDLLIVAATHTESKFISGKKEQSPVPALIPAIRDGNFRVDLLVTGPGILATSVHLTRCLESKKYNLVLNIGICGSLHPELMPVRLVKIVSERLGDFGVDDQGVFRDVFETGLAAANGFPFRNGVLKPPSVKGYQSLKALSETNGITVQKVTGSNKTAKALFEKYGPAVESMEGAAVFYVCLTSKTPCLQVRSISNLVQNRNRKNWKVTEAIDALEGWTGLFISELRSRR